MAKDPAINWYFDNWAGGTKLMSRFLKGCYMDLLDAQFHNGPLSLDEVKAVLGGDFGQAWPSLQKKFSVNPQGLFFNERLEHEKLKKKKFIEKQSLNGGKGGRPKNPNKTQTEAKQNPNKSLYETEIGIDNEFESFEEGSGETLPREGFWIDQMDKQRALTELQVGATIQFLDFNGFKQVPVQQVKDFWESFKILNCNLHKWYNSFEDLLMHFRHSFKNDLIKNSKRHGDKSSPKTQQHDQLNSIYASVRSAIERGE